MRAVRDPQTNQDYPARRQGRLILSSLVRLSPALSSILGFQIVPGLANPVFSGHPLPKALKVIAGLQISADRSLWYHVSMSRTDRIPSYADMFEVKKLMFRASSTAIQVFPPESEHVNHHATCLHLWECLDGNWSSPPDLRMYEPLLGELSI